MNKIGSKTLLLSALMLTSNFSFAEVLGLQDKVRSSQESDPRLIEPTSPILGHALVTKIKKSNSHPEVQYDELIQSDSINNEIAISTLTYFQTISPGLKSFCSGETFATLNRSKLTEVEHAAIPLEVLAPFHKSYVQNLNSNLNLNVSTGTIRANGLSIASEFQALRSNCGTAKSLTNLENKLGKLCIGPFDICEDSKKLNHILSSAEVGYPRIQYSLNGYTRFVYNQLLKSSTLKEDLRRIYDLEVKWIQDYLVTGTAKESFFGYVANESVKLGMHPNDIFLILGFSMRNMPSLDIEYAKDAKKALLLENYFWSFKKIKASLRLVKQKNLIFPNYPEGGLGIYHYLTASLLSCQARLSGQNAALAEFLGMFSKLGYKVNKLYKSINSEKWDQEGISYVKALAKKQGFGKGVDAGTYGGEFGSDICGEYYNIEEDKFDVTISKIRKDYSQSIRRGYKRVRRAGSKIKRKVQLTTNQMKLHLEYKQRLNVAVNQFKTTIKSVLND
jgi:hypothetical protein